MFNLEIQDFQESLIDLQQGIISLAAMLNKHGRGEVWLGVTEEGRPLGLTLSGQLIENILQTLAQGIEPQIQPELSLHLLEMKPCLKISVQGQEQPYFAYGRAFIRQAAINRQLTREELESFFVAENSTNLTNHLTTADSQNTFASKETSEKLPFSPFTGTENQLTSIETSNENLYTSINTGSEMPLTSVNNLDASIKKISTSSKIPVTGIESAITGTEMFNTSREGEAFNRVNQTEESKIFFTSKEKTLTSRDREEEVTLDRRFLTEKIPRIEQILLALQQEPTATAKSLAEAFGLSIQGVRYHLEHLKQQGRLVRKGPNKGGYWKLVNPNAVKSKLEKLDELKQQLAKYQPLPPNLATRLQANLQLNCIYNTNALAGNSLSLEETQIALEGITLGGKTLQEHFEALNYRAALLYIKEKAATQQLITEEEINYLHKLVFNNIQGEVADNYLSSNQQVQELLANYQQRFTKKHPVEVAAHLMSGLIKIRPFTSGNTKIGLLMANWVLLSAGYPLLIIELNQAEAYQQAKDKFFTETDTKPFMQLFIRSLKTSFTSYLVALGVEEGN